MRVLERKLESAAEHAHEDFRCFFSAEPIAGAPQAAILPEALVQGSLTVANEPPSDLRSNMKRALASFTQVGGHLQRVLVTRLPVGGGSVAGLHRAADILGNVHIERLYDD